MPVDEKLWQEVREKAAVEKDPVKLARILAQIQSMARREQEEFKAKVSQQLQGYKRLAPGESHSG